ncbi:MAG: sulfurtransferase [Cellulomonadaceae bacterium]|jgi:thiosulfate/3-mercaptopyruvate sulfurtransferase|nr:sulfurtransferase [Cellulomonadaceae bacterium]
MTSTRENVLITVAELAAELDNHGTDPSEGAPLVLDVRWELPSPTTLDYHGHADYLTGHIPGAVFVDMDQELAAPPSAAGGRHPLPATEDFQEAARRWGVRQDSNVVVYDSIGGVAAARAWWLLKYMGLGAGGSGAGGSGSDGADAGGSGAGGSGTVRILDGGLDEWEISGHRIDSGEVIAEPGDVVCAPGQMPVLDADDAAQYAAGNASGESILFDARGGARYRGDVEPIDPVAGHIPGAVSAPTGHNLTRDGLFRSDEELHARFDAHYALGGKKIGVYCGSGVTASHQVAALAIIGHPSAVYTGSWSQWCNDPSRPVATGPDPTRS